MPSKVGRMLLRAGSLLGDYGECTPPPSLGFLARRRLVQNWRSGKSSDQSINRMHGRAGRREVGRNEWLHCSYNSGRGKLLSG